MEQNHLAFVAHLAEQGKALPAYVEREFESCLKCGRFEYGFLRVRCESCHFEVFELGSLPRFMHNAWAAVGT